MNNIKDDDYDVALIGTGPSNIALMAALDEDYPSIKFVALEKRNKFSWHPGMLLPGATLQNSFLKDVATLRNPKSKYTFLNFLHSAGRLGKFIDRGHTRVSREEVTHYMEWIASHFNQHIRYSSTVRQLQVPANSSQPIQQ